MNKVLTFGEIMLRLSAPGYQRFGQATQLNVNFGGGEANVAVSLANYNVPVSFVTRLPENPLADACLNELRGLGVETNHVVRGGERMGIYFYETGAVNRPGKVVYDRAYSGMAGIKPGMIDWKSVFKDVSRFHWTGITPAISETAAEVCYEALLEAEKQHVFVSVDLNFRKNLWKYGKKAMEVMPRLVEKCDLIIGNEEDAAMTLGIRPEGVDVVSGKVQAEAYGSVSKKIMQRFPRCKMVATTLRGSVNANHNLWSGVLYDGETLVQAPQYDITHIVDRVGGGDSFSAGLIYGLLHYKKDIRSALNFAVAASALKHTIQGDYNRVTIDEVLKLMSGDSSGRVSR